jgi:diketogulonate reductase-like aldo/keto reductase
LCNQNEIVKYCFDNSIIFQAYSSLGTSDSNLTKKLFENEIIKQIAEKHSKTCAQVLLRWPIQKNICMITLYLINLNFLKINLDFFSRYT